MIQALCPQCKAIYCLHCGGTRVDRKNRKCADCRKVSDQRVYWRQALERYWQAQAQKLGR